MDGNAIVFTNGKLQDNAAKTTHGLIRGSARYKVVGVIDPVHVGKDAGELLDGVHRNIPIYPSVSDFLNQSEEKADYFIIGIANAGGKLDPHWMPEIERSLQAGMSIVNGMHEFLSEKSEVASLAQSHNASLIDVRKPKVRGDQKFWSAEIYEVKCPIIPVIGTDCAVGKRTTARFLMEALEEKGIKAPMVYTGQTGWMQGNDHGFVFDSTLNDFVSGELEHAIVSCYRESKPDMILVEGQSALRNPSGPCGSEMLISGNASGVILVHPEGRTYYKGWDFTGKKIHSIESEIELIRMYGVETLGVALNTKLVNLEEAKAAQARYTESLGIPVALPVEEGVEELLAPLMALLK
ncbi:MAG: DUF1611 domain-containing protein [Bacteroidia bacterium]|nr:DUF1611 domain-containing protein [Bacteroidia bacterium]